MKYTKLHETYVFKYPNHHKGVGGGPMHKKCNVKHKNVSELSPTLPYLEVAKYEFSVQI